LHDALPIFADQSDAVTGLKADAPKRRGHRGDLARGFGPADRAPLAVALGPQEGLVALPPGPAPYRNPFGAPPVMLGAPVMRLFRQLVCAFAIVILGSCASVPAASTP